MLNTIPNLSISSFSDVLMVSPEARQEVEDLYFNLLEVQGIEYLEYEEIDSENHITESYVKEEYNLSPEEMLEYIIENGVEGNIL